MTAIMSTEKKNAWNNVLFWAKRLSYNSASKHPEWKINYESAKKHLNEIKERELREKGGEIK